MKIVVISLARSHDRRRLVESNFARLALPFEFFNGIDGARGEYLGISRYDEIGAWRDLGRPLDPGEIGCFASHYVLWQQCLQSREAFAIVEDDAIVEEGFVQALAAVSDLLVQFPLLRLGISWEGANSATVQPLTAGLELVSLAPGTYGTQCYVVSDAGANALLKHAASWSVPVDIYLDRPHVHGLGSYGVRPYCVKHADQNAYPSVIGDQRYGPHPQNPIPKIEALLRQILLQRRSVTGSG